MHTRFIAPQMTIVEASRVPDIVAEMQPPPKIKGTLDLGIRIASEKAMLRNIEDRDINMSFKFWAVRAYVWHARDPDHVVQCVSLTTAFDDDDSEAIAQEFATDLADFILNEATRSDNDR